MLVTNRKGNTELCNTPLLQVLQYECGHTNWVCLGLQPVLMEPVPLEGFPFGSTPQKMPLCIQHNLTLNFSGQLYESNSNTGFVSHHHNYPFDMNSFIYIGDS